MLQNTEETQFIQRLEASRKLIASLKVLFGSMIKSDKKYGDPTQVLSNVTDNYGKRIEIGHEQDIGEFNDTFLSRIQEGLNFKRLYQEYKKRINKND